VHSQLLVELCEYTFCFFLRLASNEAHPMLAAPVRELPDHPTGTKSLSMDGSHYITLVARHAAL